LGVRINSSYRFLPMIFGILVPEGYGILLSAAGAGALIGALGLASIPKITPNATNLRIAGLGFAVLLAGFALSPWWTLGHYY
jgi:hypothetical protein